MAAEFCQMVIFSHFKAGREFLSLLLRYYKCIMETNFVNGPLQSQDGKGCRSGWIDVLRIMACMMVVLSHCCDGFVAQFDTDRASFLTGTLIGSLMRASVPLFVMMTGALLLPLRSGTSMGSFYRKRIGRIAVPLVFWSFALPLLAYAYFRGPGAASTNPSVDLSAYTSEGLVNKLWTWVLNFNFDTTPLWYLYMLAGLYLIIPVIDAWLRQASQKDERTFLFIWSATLFIPYLKLFAPALGYTGNYGNMEIFGECDWNAFGTFYYASGFIGYIVLAHYLIKYPLKWSNAKLYSVNAALFAIGYAITAGGYVWMQSRFPGNYAYLEIVWLFNGVNVFLMTFAMFTTVQRMAAAPRPWLKYIASLTFGIYLCHFIFIMIGYDLFDIAALPLVLRILSMFVFTFTSAAIVTALMRLTPFTRRFVE